MAVSSSVIQVPMEIEYIPAWLSWVSATTSCLRALDVECGTAEVAGLSGYAFTMNVHREFCPSGPTAFNWGLLSMGVHFLGRSTKLFWVCEGHSGESKNERTRESCRLAYEFAGQEIAAGRPCVIWGAYLPEFAVATGVGDTHFHVVSHRAMTGEPQPPIKFDEIEAPGGPYVLAFPGATDMPRSWGDRNAVAYASGQLHQPCAKQLYGSGLNAYDNWIEGLEAKCAQAFGNAYNAQCCAEAKAFARDYLELAAKRNAGPAEHLRAAAGHYGEAAAAMKRVAELFPFPPGSEVDDANVRANAVEALKDAKAAESKAATPLLQATEAEWPSC
ncbi:hypothetical protein IIA79_03530 [bacterium]|nr:hypothetical protein [bacterium]